MAYAGAMGSVQAVPLAMVDTRGGAGDVQLTHRQREDDLPQRASAALLAIRALLGGELIRAGFAADLSAYCAIGSFPPGCSPVATGMTWTGLPIRSAGRFSFLGPRAITTHPR